jgi:hypothetical protein
MPWVVAGPAALARPVGAEELTIWNQAEFGRQFYAVTTIILLGLVSLAAPAATAEAICLDKELLREPDEYGYTLRALVTPEHREFLESLADGSAWREFDEPEDLDGYILDFAEPRGAGG